MTLRWHSVVIDCRDAAALSSWWAEALGWQVAYEAPDEVVLVPPHAPATADGIPLQERGPELLFTPVPEGKQLKNRLHLDLAPRAHDDQAAEVERLVALGASRADVGQDDAVTWVVLTDPEGNEFCVLSPRD